MGSFFGPGGVPWGHGLVTHPQGLMMGWADAEKLFFCADLKDVQLDLNSLKTGSGNRFFGDILGSFFILVGSL